MQKSYFSPIATIFIATITTSIICMEELSSATPETPKFIVTLHLLKASEHYMNISWNKAFDAEDARVCKILGIEWEENNNTYWTKQALFKKAGGTKDFCDWMNCPHPKDLPLSTIANESYVKSLQYTVKFPTSLPASFVERLKKEQSITLTDTLFAEPVQIILHLKSIKNDSGDEQLTLNTSESALNDLLKEFPSTPTEILQSSENNDNNHIEPKVTSQPKTTHFFSRIFSGKGISYITFAGIVVGLLYIYRDQIAKIPMLYAS